MNLIHADKYEIFFQDVIEIISKNRRLLVKKLHESLVQTYWQIGCRIVEEEQKGKKRAQYGKQLIKNLSCDLSNLGEKGFKATNLKYMRQFYTLYPKKELLRKGILWTHYKTLIRLDTDAHRRFYEDRIIRELFEISKISALNKKFCTDRELALICSRKERIKY